MFDWIIAYGIITFQVVMALSVIMMTSAYLSAFFGSMWVPSSLGTVQKMLRLADLQPGQRLVDLGAGDGRVVIMAARKFQAEAVGVEIDPLRYVLANFLIVLLGLRRQAWVYYASVYDFDLAGANAVIIYLTRGANEKLKPHLAEQLRPGAKVVARFAVPGWTPLAMDDTKMIFVYEIGNVGSEVKTKFI